MRRIHVVITEDSDVAAQLLARALEAAPDIHVVGRFVSVEDLMKSSKRLLADVIMLDMWLPGRHGLGVIRELARERPVIVVSDIPDGSPLAREAVAQGAAAVFAKKELATDAGVTRLRAAVRAAVRERPVWLQPVVAIVGSTGAMVALRKLLPSLAGAEASTLIVQHMPPGREASFAEWVTSLGVPARPASGSDALEVGRALVATSIGHLVIDGPQRVASRPGPAFEGHCPSGTVLLESAALLADRLVAVILSGMGSDGAIGVAKVVERGATCLVQAPASCAVDSMPTASLAVSSRVRALPIEELGPAIAAQVSRQRFRG